MIFKVLVLGIVIYLVYIKFFKVKVIQDIGSKKSDEIIDDLDECPTCKTFISKDDAILSNGQYYCSKECLNK